MSLAPVDLSSKTTRAVEPGAALVLAMAGSATSKA